MTLLAALKLHFLQFLSAKDFGLALSLSYSGLKSCLRGPDWGAFSGKSGPHKCWTGT